MQHRIPTRVGCLAGILLVVLAYLLQSTVWSRIPAAPFLLFYPAVIFAAYLGTTCGVLTTVLSAVVIDYAFLPPYNSFNIGTSWLSELIFLAIGTGFTFLIDRQKALYATMRRLQKRNEAQKKNYEVLLDATDDHVFMFDRNMRFVYLNRATQGSVRAALTHLGKDPDQPIVGKSNRELGYAEDTLKKFESDLKRALAGETVKGELLHPSPLGMRVFEYVLSPVYDSHRRIVAATGFTRDIHDRKTAEDSLQRSLKTREEMLAVVSHDLRNPLGAILMSCALIKRNASGQNAFIAEQARKIQRAGQQMNDIIEDLLNLAKMEAGKFVLTKQDICGCDIVTDTVEIMAPKAQEKDIRIETSGTNQPLQMSCDHSQVLRVLSNIIGNAIKFTPEHGLIRVTAEDRGNEVLFTVSDTGPGIAEHHLPYVFDRFWQAARTRHMGTGLGLAIAKGIVEAHNGRIWVTSRFGEGAKFAFTLPKARSTTGTSGKAA